MNITYTGKQEYLHPDQQSSLETKIGKISKLIEANGQPNKNAHFILGQQKNLFHAEITMNYLDHALIGEHSDGEQFTAICVALEKLEKQLLKLKEKRRDTKKGPKEVRDRDVRDQTAQENVPADPVLASVPAAAHNGKPKIFRVAPSENKPMTLEEAMLFVEDDYFVYRDVNTDRLSVLLRRQDGDLDLVEC